MQIKINAGFYLLCAVLVLLFPIKWVVAWIVAMSAHELFHYFALRILGVQIYEISVAGGGAIMKTESLTKLEEIIAALAGPIGGLALLLLSRWAPYVAICGAIQSAYNLIPLFPLDGGRAMLRFLQLMFHDAQGLAIYRFIKFLFCIGIIILSLIGHYLGFGIAPIIAAVFIIGKCSCKHG